MCTSQKGNHPPNNPETADNQATCSTDAVVTRSHIDQARLGPEVTREQVANASREMLRTTLGWVREKTSLLGLHTEYKDTESGRT